MSKKNEILLIQDTENFKATLLNDFKKEIEKLKTNFQAKVPSEYLTRNEVSKMLKIDLSTLWSHTRKGRLKSYGLGSRVYYKREEVENAIIELKR